MAFWRPFDTEENLHNENLDENVEDEVTESNELGWEFKNKDLHVQTQRLLLNIYNCLRRENNQMTDTDIIKRMFELTKISISAINVVIKKGVVVDHSVKRERKNQKFRKIDDASKDVIRRTVYNFYQENKVPTLEMISNKLREYPDYNYRSLETLRCILLECGFKYKKINNRLIIMESRRIVEIRQEYLRKIKEYRESNRTIIYLDETWFDTHDTVNFGWVDTTQKCTLNAPCSRGKRVIILHAGSENGFVPNALLLSAKNITQSSADYHEDMTAVLFEKWFDEQLLPNIPPNSVIVMDNASYHSRILNKVPNNKTKKEDIIKFMRSKNINIPDKIPKKKDLLKTVKEHNFKKEYVVDHICETHGHSLLRLPPYYCIFNPIELIWGSLKHELRKCNQNPTLSAVILDNIRTVISDLDKTDIWKKSVNHVINKENEYPILPPVEPVVIQVGNDSSSELTDDSVTI